MRDPVRPLAPLGTGVRRAREARNQAACHRLQPPHRSFFRICLSVRSPRGRPRKKQDKHCAIERYVCSVVAEQSVMRRPPEARIDTPGWLCAPAAAKVSLSFDPARGVFRAIRERWSAEYQHRSADAGHGRRLGGGQTSRRSSAEGHRFEREHMARGGTNAMVHITRFQECPAGLRASPASCARSLFRLQLVIALTRPGGL